MREILFRAKLKSDNGIHKKGEWVYGHYCVLIDGKKAIPYIYGNGEVNKNTVGQYTGLPDKNGTKIFEGDILQVCRGNDIDTGYVLYDERMASYSISVTKNECLLFVDWFIAKQEDNRVWIEVIGNIHDNPELLKGGGTNA